MNSDITKLSNILLSMLVQLSYKNGMTRTELKKFVDDACDTQDTIGEIPFKFATRLFDDFEKELYEKGKTLIKEPTQ